MNGLLLIVICILAAPRTLVAEPPRKGRVLCEGTACQSHDIPTGSLIERSGVDVEDASRLTMQNPKPEAPPKTPKARRRKKANATLSRVQVTDAPSNLPPYHQGVDRSDAESSDKVVYTPKVSRKRLKGLGVGDVVWAVIEQEITASPNVPSPVRAMAVSGPFQGAMFVGEATLDHDLKRILVTFTAIRIKGQDESYTVKAVANSPRGSIGLEGEYVSHSGKFFVAELASAAAAGFVDATITRNQTAFGTYSQEPSLSNSGKAAAATALAKTTERMAEQARSAPEYTRVAGYQEIQIIIKEDPVEAGS